MGTLVLVCAVLAALAAGVLLAYGVCQALFALFNTHARLAEPTRAAQVTHKPQIAEV